MLHIGNYFGAVRQFLKLQADGHVAMIQAVKAVVHGGEPAAKALALYETLRSEATFPHDFS